MQKKDGKYRLIPENTPKPVDGRCRPEETSVVSAETVTKYTKSGTCESVLGKFRETYLKEPKNVAFTPYRICPIGAHSDHDLGKITGFAIDKGIYIAYGPKQNGIIELQSMQFPSAPGGTLRKSSSKRKTTGRTICAAEVRGMV